MSTPVLVLNNLRIGSSSSWWRCMGHGLSGFIASFFIQVRRSSLPMAKHADRRSRALVRVRLLLRFQDIYLISLLFFLSGLFVWPSLARSGSRIFVRERVSVEELYPDSVNIRKFPCAEGLHRF